MKKLIAILVMTLVAH